MFVIPTSLGLLILAMSVTLTLTPDPLTFDNPDPDSELSYSGMVNITPATVATSKKRCKESTIVKLRRGTTILYST